MTEKSKPAQENTQSGNKKDTAVPTTETAPISKPEATAMLIPEEGNDPTGKG